MRKRCTRTCDRKNYLKAESTGRRSKFYYPGGGTYEGFWLNSRHQSYGVKTSKEQLIYDGQWDQGKRHGHGTLRRRLPDGSAERIYVGDWKDDMKCGEGKQFYSDGVYYGWWSRNRRNGLGIKWYTDGKIYLGEWEADVPHGIGILFYEDGNRYEGHFAMGFKNGEGCFYHMHTGQLQKGMWLNDICKASLISDELRQQTDHPTEYPIPQCEIAEPDAFICQLFRKYIHNANAPSKSFNELRCHNFVHKMHHYIKLEPRSIWNSNIAFDVDYPCTCKETERPT